MLFLAVVLFSSADALSSGVSGEITHSSKWREGHGSCRLDISMRDPFYNAALSPNYMKNPNFDQICGPHYCIRITGVRGSIVVKVSDTCSSCAVNDIVIADDVYQFLDDPRKGRVRMEWYFVDCQIHHPGRA